MHKSLNTDIMTEEEEVRELLVHRGPLKGSAVPKVLQQFHMHANMGR